MVKDPADVLDRQKCLDALAALRHAKWFQVRNIILLSYCSLMRCIIYLFIHLFVLYIWFSLYNDVENLLFKAKNKNIQGCHFRHKRSGKCPSCVLIKNPSSFEALKN